MPLNDSDAERRPIIGITTYAERARFGVWDTETAVLARTYPDSVARAGGVPVLLPPVGNGFAELVNRLDGLILAGGADIDPARYDAPAHPETAGIQPDRDAYEYGLLAAGLAVDLPILAICRGAQILNTALGGTLHQHLPDKIGTDDHRQVPGTFTGNRIAIEPGCRTADILGTATSAQCHHHQALARIAAELTVVGTASDGTIEAVEAPGYGFVLGVQWHPEENPGDDRLMAALVEAAERSARKRFGQ